jgi:thioredoxin-dependent peroxiredoxin
MTIRLGDTAPDFTAVTTAGLLSFHEWKAGSWAVLFSHPADFTPVCTTELGRTAAPAGEFAARDAKPIAVSVDSVDDHHAWVPAIAEVAGGGGRLPDHRRRGPGRRAGLRHDPPR